MSERFNLQSRLMMVEVNEVTEVALVLDMFPILPAIKLCQIMSSPNRIIFCPNKITYLLKQK